MILHLMFLEIHMMFVKFLWVSAKKFCVKLQLNSFLIFNSPAIRAKDLLSVQTCFSIGKILFSLRPVQIEAKVYIA